MIFKKRKTDATAESDRASQVDHVNVATHDIITEGMQSSAATVRENDPAVDQLVRDLIEDAKNRAHTGAIKELCQEYLKHKSYRIARRILDLAKSEFPNDANVHELLARACHFLGDHPAEADAWQRAAELTDRVDFKVCEAHARMRTGDFTQAEAILLATSGDTVDRFDIASGLAECAYRRNDLMRAFECWTRAAELDPQDLNAPLQRTNVLIEMGDLRTAEAIIDDAQQRWPGSALVAETKARVLKSRADYPAALEFSQLAVVMDSSPNLSLTHASVLLALGRSDDACQTLRQALARQPRDTSVLAMLAECEEAAGRRSIALATWRGLLHFQPNFVRAHIETARLENIGRSAQDYRDALLKIAGRYPLAAEPLVAVADIARDARQQTEVASLWNRILTIAPSRKEFWLRCAAALRECDKLDAAETVVWQALELFPEDRDLLEDALDLSTGLEHQARAVEAGKRLTSLLRQRTISNEPGSPNMGNALFNAYTRLTWLHFNVGDFESTRVVCEEIAEVWPNCAFYLELQAMMSIRERNWHNALDFARTYNYLFPNYPRGIELEYEALLGAREFNVAVDLLTREDLSTRFPEWTTRFAAWRDAVRSIRSPEQPTDTRLVLDVTSLATVVAASAAPGGIERTIVEVVLELFESWKGNLVLVNWKTIAVEVSHTDFMSAIFPTSYGESSQHKINPFVQRALANGEKAFESSPYDIVVILGSAWHYDANNAILDVYKQAGSRVAIYIHDLLQLYYPALVSEKWAAIFRYWIGPALDRADLVMVNSNHSGREIQQFCAETGRQPIETIKVELGDDYRCLPRKQRVDEAKVSSVLRLAKSAGYVMFVSALGKRKNHGFLVRAWDRLRKMSGEDCPTLVFVGSPGDGMTALEAELRATQYAGGKVVLLHNVDDASLDKLYDNCLFTVFPSLCEGWGLPIAEALSHGKVCLASVTTSMPEVGGDCADYFTPTDENAFIALATQYVYDHQKRAEREAYVRKHYQRRKWSATTEHIVSLIDTRLLASGGKPILPIPRTTQIAGVIQICASFGKQCGIASYTSHVAAAMRAQGRDAVIVRGVDECERYLATGRYGYVLVQHEYGLYDSFNPSLAGPDTTGELIEQLENYAERYPNVRSTVVMHTIDMNKSDLRERSQMLFNSTIPVITLSSAAARNTRAIFVEHGIHVTSPIVAVETSARAEGDALTVSSFGFLSPHKRIDRILQACADSNCRLVANFACDSAERAQRAHELVTSMGVAGKVTFDFQTDDEILATLRAGDVVYFPQGPISYWATTGSARVAMTADRPVVTSPEDQFEDMAAGVIFATDAGLPAVLRRLSNPTYYAQVLDRLRVFRDGNTIDVVYRDALQMLNAERRAGRIPSAGSAITASDLLALPARTAAKALYTSQFDRQPTSTELESFEATEGASDEIRLAAIFSVACDALTQGRPLDLAIDPVHTALLTNSELAAIDSNRLVSALSLLLLDRATFIDEAMLSIAKRRPSDSERTELDAMQADDIAARMSILRAIVRIANKARATRSAVGDLQAHLYLQAPVPGQIQQSRRRYHLSELCAYPAGYRAIAVYRELFKRDPSLDEHLALSSLDSSDAIDRIRQLAITADAIHMVDNIPNHADWLTKMQGVQSALEEIGNTQADELTGDNLCSLEMRRLSRAFPSFVLLT
ncbi:glycosyltransferase [Burkholderia pyrrocinia]|uniref:glycosyltransferase n=1 Tax=Burkholderia pyrrocinia TaxID=60550 RepID=UPI0038B41AEF